MMVAKLPQEIEERAFERSSNREKTKMDFSEVAPVQHDMFSSVQFAEAGFSTDAFEPSHDRASLSKERQRFGRARKHIQSRKTQEAAGEMKSIEKRIEADKSLRRHPPLLPSKSDMEAHLSTKTAAQRMIGRNRVSNENITCEASTSNSNLLSDPQVKKSSRDFNSFSSGLQGELREDSDSSTSQFLKLLGSDKSGELPRLPPSDQKKRVAVLSDNFIESLAGSFSGETTGSKERLSITQVHRQLRTKDNYPPDSLIEALTKASCAPAQETQRRQEQIHSDGLDSLETSTEGEDLDSSSSSLRRSISSPSPRQQWSLNPMRLSWSEKIPRSNSTDSLPVCEAKLTRKQSKSRRKRGDKTYFDC